jgi:hypothetical protein
MNQQKKEVITVLIVSIFIRLMAFLIIFLALLGTNNSFLQGFNHWDSVNFLTICEHGGYALPELTYPDSIKLFAFYPALPVVYCGVAKILGTNILLAALLINTLFFLLLCKELSIYITREYTDKNLRAYIFLCFLFFPFSWFLQVNYTETLFLWLTLLSINLIHSKNIWLSHLAGFFVGFTRSTAFAAAVGNWIIYTKECFKKDRNITEPINKNLKYFSVYILKSTGFLSYGMGTVILLSYYQLTYGDWHLFFASQKDYYGRQVNLNFWQGWVTDLTTLTDKWFTVNNQHDYQSLGSENFIYYLSTQQSFNTVFLLYFPLILAFIGSAYLIYKKQYDKLAWSWLLLIMPIMTGETTSINRYLISSFPLLFAVFELTAKNNITKYIWLVFSVLLWILIALWFIKGFWIG